jgi:hypothetical protein
MTKHFIVMLGVTSRLWVKMIHSPTDSGWRIGTKGAHQATTIKAAAILSKK